MSRYGVFSGPYSPVFGFGLNTGKYGPEKTPYLDSFHKERKKPIKGVHTDPGMSVVEWIEASFLVARIKEKFAI